MIPSERYPSAGDSNEMGIGRKWALRATHVIRHASACLHSFIYFSRYFSRKNLTHQESPCVKCKMYEMRLSSTSV